MSTKSFGQILREAREAKGLTTSQLAERTNIIVQIIEDMENEDFHRIVARVFGVGFVTNICKCLELDPKPLCNNFVDIFEGRCPPKIHVKNSAVTEDSNEEPAESIEENNAADTQGNDTPVAENENVPTENYSDQPAVDGYEEVPTETYQEIPEATITPDYPTEEQTTPVEDIPTAIYESPNNDFNPSIPDSQVYPQNPVESEPQAFETEPPPINVNIFSDSANDQGGVAENVENQVVLETGIPDKTPVFVNSEPVIETPLNVPNANDNNQVEYTEPQTPQVPFNPPPQTPFNPPPKTYNKPTVNNPTNPTIPTTTPVVSENNPPSVPQGKVNSNNSNSNGNKGPKNTPPPAEHPVKQNAQPNTLRNRMRPHLQRVAPKADERPQDENKFLRILLNRTVVLAATAVAAVIIIVMVCVKVYQAADTQVAKTETANTCENGVCEVDLTKTTTPKVANVNDTQKPPAAKSTPTGPIKLKSTGPKIPALYID